MLLFKQIILMEALAAPKSRFDRPLVVKLSGNRQVNVPSFIVVIYSVVVSFLFGAAATESFTNIGKYSIGGSTNPLCLIHTI